MGNPGPRYASTRHNIGRQIVDLLARRHGLVWERGNKHAALAAGEIAGRRVVLAKLKSYMNESGRPAAGLVQRYRLDPSRLLVVYDDLDLPLGRLRLRPEGSSGGHRGMDSLIRHLGSQAFPRLRVGIGRPESSDPMSYVLSPFGKDQEAVMAEARQAAAGALELVLALGIEQAMNEVNCGRRHPALD